MKKILSLLMALALIVNVSAVDVHAADKTNDELVDAFAERMVSMVYKNKFLDAVETVHSLGDVNGFVSMYTSAFGALGSSDEISSVKLFADLVVLFEDGIESGSAGMDKLRNDFGSAGALSSAIQSSYTSLYNKIISTDEETMALAISRGDLAFAAVSTVSIGFLETTAAYSNLTVNGADAEMVLILLSLYLPDTTISYSQMMNALNQFINYYNATSDRAVVYDLVDSYGFVEVKEAQPEPSPVPDPNPTDDEDLPDEDTPEAGDDEDGLDLDDDGIAQGPVNFIDLDGVSWAQEAIASLSKNGIVKGVGNSRFNPNGNVTRAELSAMLVRMLELTAEGNNPFEDVEPSDWFAEEVTAAYENGVIKVYGKKCKAREAVSRQEISDSLARVLVLNGYKAPAGDGIADILSVFADQDDISLWARGGAASVVEIGVMQGEIIKGERYFEPKDNVTRAEVAVVLYRLSQFVETTLK